MSTIKLPDYFTTLKRGKVSLFVHKKYEAQLSEQDLNTFFGLYGNSNTQPLCIQSEAKSKGHPYDQYARGLETGASYHGRTPCKSILLKSLNNGSFVVRDYWHGGMFGKLLRDIFWQGVRPIQELVICESASQKGIPTIEIVAIIKNRFLGPFYKSKLISREIKNSIDLMELLLRYDKNTFYARKRAIISKVAHAIKEMHDAGIYHADLNLKNILLQTVGRDEFVAYIIDLDKSKQCNELKPRSRIKNLMRLDRSLEKFKRNTSQKNHSHLSCARYITNGDKLRFMREYFSVGRRRAPLVAVRSHEEKLVRQEGGTKSLRNQDEWLKTCIHSYVSSYKTHRFWWWLADFSGKK